MLGGNASHIFFQHLETTSTLEALQHKNLAHYSIPKITCQQKRENLSIHAKIFMPTKNLIPYQQKFLMTKESMTQKKKKINAPPKFYLN